MMGLNGVMEEIRHTEAMKKELRNKLARQVKHFRSLHRNAAHGHAVRLAIWAMLDHHGQAKPFLK